ncbi:prepilin-type N-terminal cleavage/methylation domain-containing protein [Geothrix sp. 21YS21S-4]|uniref:prepilin-type N-terminal cleavage/methylation domain-containing protein n=1 Tax=Geothrix sp. 21YS21S-4 TaxID=3068889 RepID=UPI0027B9F01C|nr:prepilin-type N-terminal cleavage/methylation domain-containing protein [Geothrix sp. 21YS21S-4]
MRTSRHPSRASGYSLIELLAVMAIVAILAIAAVTTIGNRPGSAVRSVMDELEGVLVAAHKRTTSTLADVTLTTNGVWGNTTTPALLSFNGAADLSGETFRYVRGSRDYDYAGVDCGNGWANDAVASLRTVVPTNADPFRDALTRALFTGSLNPPLPDPTKPTVTSFVVNGYSKRFNQGFYIAVVGMRNGFPITSGPVGVIVVPGGGNSIYKFYRSNSAESWRRL